jgi:hypothetical protein
VSADSGRSPGPQRGFWPRRGPTYQDARVARSGSWLPAGFVVFGVVGVAVLVLASTRIGRVVGTASEHFLLYYAGVFVLLALTATVGIGLLSTDRIIMRPASRVTAQAVHRAASVGAMAFLFIHIASEIAASRSHALDVVFPFLDHGRTFYLGLGTVASDLMVMIAVTGIFRARLAANMSPLKWRLLHCSAYAAWLIAIVHGLLAGRSAKSFFGFSGFVAWSYGFCVVAVAIALGVRLVAKDRSGQTQGQPIAERPVTPWSPAALGAPALGQAGFGAPQLSAAPARPYQRALPAPAPASAAVGQRALPAGRGQIGDGRSGPDETPMAFGQDDTGGHSGFDEARVAFGRDGLGGAFGRDEPRVAFGRDDPRGYPGRGDTRGFAGQDDPRGYPGPADPRRYPGQGDTRGFTDRDDPRGYPGQGDTRGFAGQADPRGYPGQGDTRGFAGQADPRGYPGQDDPRGYPGRDDVRGYPGQDDPRGYPGRDDVRGYPGQDARGFADRDGPRGYPGQGDPRAYPGPDDVRGYPGPGDVRAYPGRNDARAYPDQDDPRAYPGQGDPRAYPGQVDGRGYPSRDDSRGGFGQNETRMAFGRDDARGYPGRDDGRAYPGRDDPPGRFDSSDDSSAEEETGPLPVVPYSPYGTRS